MALVDLETVRENLEYMLDSFRRLPVPGSPDEEYADACLLAWRRSRQLAIAVLLTEADSSAFFRHLTEAGEIRSSFLKSTTSRPDDFAEYRRAGDLGGFADALAAGQVDLAAEIAGESAGEWSPDYEYEEDFCYAKVLQTLVANDFAPHESCEEWLAALNRVVDDEPTAQGDLAAALVTGDATAFHEGLVARVEEHRALFELKGAGLIADPDEYATERHVFVEGLALKVVARRRGIDLADEEPLMPREAWIAASG